jgi:heme exporter protein A
MQVIADNLSVKRGEELVFEGVCFQLTGGESLTITGPNGVGKSTLLRALSGLMPFSSGRFTIDDGLNANANHSSSDEKPSYEYCHYIGHQNAMKAELSVLENLNFWQGQMGGGDQCLSPEAAAEVLGLSHTLDLPFGFLSQGQRRRIALAKLFISRRAVWLLDEPTSALDHASGMVFTQLTKDYIKSGGIVIAATHVPLGFTGAKTLEMVPLSRDAGFDADESYF